MLGTAGKRGAAFAGLLALIAAAGGLAACGRGGDAHSAKLIESFETQSSKPTKYAPVDDNKIEFANRLAISPDGKFLSDGPNEWKLIGDRMIVASHWQSFEDSTGPVAYSPDSQVLATHSLSTPAQVLLWHADTGPAIMTLDTGHTAAVQALAFSPDGRTLATGSLDTTAKLWDVSSGKSIALLTGCPEGVASLVFSSDGGTLFAGCERGSATWWDVSKPAQRAASQMTADFGTVAGTVWKTDEPGISAVTDYSPDLQLFAYASMDRLSLWSTATGKQQGTIAGSTPADFTRLIGAAKFSPNGRIIALSTPKVTELWDVRGAKRLAVLDTGDVSGIAFSPDGRQLAVVQDPNNVVTPKWELWDIQGPISTLKP